MTNPLPIKVLSISRSHRGSAIGARRDVKGGGGGREGGERGWRKVGEGRGREWEGGGKEVCMGARGGDGMKSRRGRLCGVWEEIVRKEVTCGLVVNV